ncbi:hypothetical protein HDU76_007375, partial [Blyttiomyces sp. JEL0837]
MSKSKATPGSGNPVSGSTIPENINTTIGVKIIDDQPLPRMNAIFLQGYRSPLDLKDLYPLAPRHQATGMADKFEKLWAERTAKYHTEYAEWNASNKSTKPPKKPSIVGVLFTMFARGFLPVGLIKFSWDVANSSAPLVLQRLLTFIQNSQKSNPDPLWIGYLCAIGLFLLNMYATVAVAVYFQKAAGYGMDVRATMTAAVYRKSLRLSGAAKQEFNPGRITNIISTDLVRLDAFVAFLHLFWTFPIQVIAIIALLVSVLGPSALAGVCLLIAMVPLQAYIIRLLVNLRKANATTTDERVKLTAETLGAIRVIKFFALVLRHYALSVVCCSLFLVTASGFAIPVLAACISFMVYGTVSPDSFTPVTIFTAMALFNQLRTPIMWTPMMISSYADASVAFKRLQALFECEDIEFEPITDPNAAVAIEVEHGNFTWEVASSSPDIEDGSPGNGGAGATVNRAIGVGDKENQEGCDNDKSSLAETIDEVAVGAAPVSLVASRSELQDVNVVDSMEALITGNASSEQDDALVSSKQVVDEEKGIELRDVVASASPSIDRITLRNIDISIPKGALVAIVGSVGSGKSSLLSAIVGQLKPVDEHAKVIFSGSVGYVPQQAWIMNATLKENVLFGLGFDEERYIKAIDVCALRRDLEVLAGGDGAEIGERGINLSGGQKQR